ncbi:hypothetical protein R3P38DRAFT_3202792 [Favolaschia claudopus]|uniref:Uncharacterized protein n=1 Tax=Favolaschia claudopus TaxID=2862362 RepID=A0AAW0AT96_9AGAR
MVFIHAATTYNGLYTPSRPAFARAAIPDLAFTSPTLSPTRSAPKVAIIFHSAICAVARRAAPPQYPASPHQRSHIFALFSGWC